MPEHNGPVRVKPVDWPTVKIGSREITFRMSYSAVYQLQTWGTPFGVSPRSGARMPNDFEVGVACAGTFDARGKWHSLGLTPLEFTDMMIDEGGDALTADAVANAATEATKKVFPGPALYQAPQPGETDSTRSDGSQSGPLEPPVAASA
jgi:hypothetical protein